ncbi:MAG: dethiobiotin synthase [Pirellulaceae bacterium]
MTHSVSPLRLRSVVMLGTDTDVGKTYQACRLIGALAKSGIKVGAYKPVASGVEEGVASDPELLNSAAGGDWPPEWVCPQLFRAAVAPPVAAELEDAAVDDALLFSGAAIWEKHCDFLVIEGAGGVLSPLSFHTTALDLACRLATPVILVAANRLGVVNHTRLSLEAAQQRGLEVKGVVLNSWKSNSAVTQDRSITSNLRLLERFLGEIPLVDDAAKLESTL